MHKCKCIFISEFLVQKAYKDPNNNTGLFVKELYSIDDESSDSENSDEDSAKDPVSNVYKHDDFKNTSLCYSGQPLRCILYALV